MRTLVLVCLLVSCNSVPAPSPGASVVVKPAGDQTPPAPVALQPLDEKGVLETLTSSHAPISRLKKGCQLLYADPSSENLGSIVTLQYGEAKSWEARCKRRGDRRSECVVTLENSEGEDEEFMSRYSFELDENQMLIESSVDCVFAG